MTARRAENLQESSQYTDETNDAAKLQQTINTTGFTAEGIAAITSALQSENAALANNNELAEENALIAARVSDSTDKLNNDLSDEFELISSLNDGTDQSAKYSKEYSNAIAKVTDAVSEMVGVDVDSDFVLEHLDDIEKAADGDVDALAELTYAAGQTLPSTWADASASSIEKLQAAAADVENGFQLEADVELNDEEFIAQLNSMLQAGEMSADQLKEYLNGIGYDLSPDVEYKTVTTKTSYDLSTTILGKKVEATMDMEKSMEVPIIKKGDVQSLGGGGLSAGSRGGSAGGSKSSGSGGGGGSSSKEEPWENPFDKLYNLDKKIEKEVRQISKLEHKREVDLRDSATTIQDLVANSTERIKVLNQEISDAKSYIASRQSEIDSIASEYSDVSKYVWYDKSLGATQINWSAIDSVTDKDVGERIKEAEEAYNNVQDTIEDMEDKIDDAIDTLNDIEETIRDNIIDYQTKLYEAVVEAAQRQIDRLSNINDSVNDANSKLMDAIDKSLAKDRQERSNKETEEDLADKQARLEYLRQDTSGANALEIKQLEEELADAQQDYTDSLIDQRLEEISEANDAAAQQREEQISLLQSIHDWQKDYGGYDSTFWTEVYRLQDEAYANNPSMGWSQEIEDLLTENEALGMSYREWEKWLEEAKNIAKEGTEALDRTKQTLTSDYTWTKIGEAITTQNRTSGYKTYQDTVKSDVYQGTATRTTTVSGARSDNAEDKKILSSETLTKTENRNGQTLSSKLIADNTPTGPSDDEIAHMIAGNIWIYGTWGNGNTRKTRITNRYGSGMYSKVQGYLNAYAYNGTLYREWKNGANFKAYHYATGGLADFTGPAWLDGTPAKPEIVLNAKDSANFIQLKEILSDALKGGSDNSNAARGDNYYDINVNVDTLSSDYDVEQVAKQIKKMIVNDSTYRNVNAINRLR
jgi:hypothetical protein